MTNIRCIANQYGGLCSLLGEINGYLAIVNKFTDDGQDANAFEHLTLFLSYSLAEKIDLIEKATSHKTLKKFFNQYSNQTDATEAFLLMLADCHERFETFFRLLSMEGVNAKTLSDLICDFETLNAYSEGHERLFELMLGLTDVNGIEGAIAATTEQNTWQGASEGRYAYASSLTRLKRFYDSVPLSKQDVVYDLGSGYGHSVFYGVLKFPEITFKGVEYIADRVVLSNHIARQFDFKNVVFYAQDIRDFDFSDGTVFYLYSPFTREIKIETFDRLIALGQQKHIRLFLYDTDQLGVFEKRSDVFRQISSEVFESRI